MTGRVEPPDRDADMQRGAAVVMECRICWTPYDPAVGDETRQISPGTPFRALPDDWHCPTCDAPKAQFLPRVGAGGRRLAEAAPDAAVVARLVDTFREIHREKMRDVPFCNPALAVEAVGIRLWQGRTLGVLVAPWFMNLVLLPALGEDWSGLATGAKELLDFPSGTYEFIHTVRRGVGGYKTCSLFSPMADFTSQQHATDVARAVMHALFDEANRVVAPPTAAGDPAEQDGVPGGAVAPTVPPTRRAILAGGGTAGR